MDQTNSCIQSESTLQLPAAFKVRSIYSI